MRLTNRGKSIVYRCLAFLVYVIPMTILFIANYKAYTNTAGSVGFWGFVIIAFCILSFKNTIIECFKKRALTTFSIAILIIAIVMRFLADEIILIATISTVGSVLSSFIEVVADTYDNLSYKLIDGVKQRNTDQALSDKKAWAMAYGFITK